VPLAEHAREIGMPERTLRRQLYALHQRMGGGVLRSYNVPGTRVGKWFFNRAVTRAVLAREPDDTEVALGEHLTRIEKTENRLAALRQSLKSLRALVNTLQNQAKV
jgi:Mg2+ and Co2+ transporter CorA